MSLSKLITLDFDIALLGCGGYGLPLCNYIKKSLKKMSDIFKSR